MARREPARPSPGFETWTPEEIQRQMDDLAKFVVKDALTTLLPQLERANDFANLLPTDIQYDLYALTKHIKAELAL